MYLIEVTHPWTPSVSLEYQPKIFLKETPEEAVQIFMAEAGNPALDRGALVERLADGKTIEHQDKETGCSVVAKVGERCVRCSAPYQGTPSWQRTTAGLLCPDCTVDVCPEDAEPVKGGVA